MNPIRYIRKWNYTQAGYAHFNRTQMTSRTDAPVWKGVTTAGVKDAATVQGDLNKVFYTGNWSSNSANTWGASRASFEMKFKETGVKLFGLTNPFNGTAGV